MRARRRATRARRPRTGPACRTPSGPPSPGARPRSRSPTSSPGRATGNIRETFRFSAQLTMSDHCAMLYHTRQLFIEWVISGTPQSGKLLVSGGEPIWRDWPRLPSDIDAAVQYSANNHLYFFKGENYWKFSTSNTDGITGFASPGSKLFMFCSAQCRTKADLQRLGSASWRQGGCRYPVEGPDLHLLQ